MTLLELYNLKLKEYEETGLKEKPWELLAMLLLSEKDKYKTIINSKDELAKEINKKIEKFETDFKFPGEDYDKINLHKMFLKKIKHEITVSALENNTYGVIQESDPFIEDSIFALMYGVKYKNESTPEEIYSEYFDTDILKKNYDIEQKAKANNINITTLNNLINKIIDNQSEFYKKVCEELTEEERLFILKELENKSCMNCANQSCRVEYSEKVGTDELDNPKGSKCFGWFNSELIGRCKVLGKTDIKQLK